MTKRYRDFEESQTDNLTDELSNKSKVLGISSWMHRPKITQTSYANGLVSAETVINSNTRWLSMVASLLLRWLTVHDGDRFGLKNIA